jgi:hypothetical protein
MLLSKAYLMISLDSDSENYISNRMCVERCRRSIGIDVSNIGLP